MEPRLVEIPEIVSGQREDPKCIIYPVSALSDLRAIVSLIKEYADWIDIDLSYQDYARELASMPGKYSPTAGGCLLIARHQITNEPLGCVAMRALPQPGNRASCEMKRLYVAPAGRRSGLGRSLALKVMDEAKNMGYSDMYLDTLPFMHAAVNLYEDIGFRRVDKYYNSPLPETIFFVKSLQVHPN